MVIEMENIGKLAEPDPIYYHSSGTSLLKKFNVPLQHLDFDYVNQCKDAKELEKILQILKSGEEGYYPQLIERTEQRLTAVKPNSIHIRKMTRVISQTDLDADQRTKISGDLHAWLKDISKKNNELEGAKTISKGKTLPDVRKHKEYKQEEKIATTRIRSTDYVAWDKYDAETELLKMDLEEERLKKEALKLSEKQETKKVSVRINQFATGAEAAFEAQRENEKGNEYFNVNEYENALSHYNNAITFFPNATAYRNRASTYMMLKTYEGAISDYKIALKYEKNDFESLFRLAQCYYLIKNYEMASAYMEKAIQLNPNQTSVQELAERIKNSINGTNSHKARMKVHDVDAAQTRTKKSILKKDHEAAIIPIPGTSKMAPPFYKSINTKDPIVIRREEQILMHSARPGRTLMQSCIESCQVDDDKECTVDHFEGIRTKDVSRAKQNDDAATNIPNKTENCARESAKLGCGVGATTGQDDTRTEHVVRNPREKSQVSIHNGHGTQNFQESNERVAEQRSLTRSVEHRIALDNSLEDSHRDDLHASGEPYTEQNNHEESEIMMPFSFLQACQTARTQSNYYGFVNVIKNIDANRIQQVIGNQMDASMLRDMLNCMYRHLMVAHEVETIYNVLINLCRVDRFNIISMFLTRDDRTLVTNLVNFLCEHGRDIPREIKRQYGLDEF